MATEKILSEVEGAVARLFAKGIILGLISLGVLILGIAYGDLFGLARENLETGKFIAAKVAAVVLILAGVTMRLVMMSLQVRAVVRTEVASKFLKEGMAKLDANQQAAVEKKIEDIVTDQIVKE